MAKKTSIHKRKVDDKTVKVMKQRSGPRILFRGIEFYGGSKKVKTYLVNVIARETIRSSHFLVLETNQFVMKFLHQIEKLVRTYIYNCRRHKKYAIQPLVLFLNEIDTLFTTPVDEVDENSSENSCIKTSIKAEFLLQMRGSSPLLVLGSTEISWALTWAIRRKFAERDTKPFDVCVGCTRLVICNIHLNTSSHIMINQNSMKLGGTFKENSATDFSVVVRKPNLKVLRKKHTWLGVPTFFSIGNKIENEAINEYKAKNYLMANRLFHLSLQCYLDCCRFENVDNIFGTQFMAYLFAKHSKRIQDIWAKLVLDDLIRRQLTGKRIRFRGYKFFGRLRTIRAHLTKIIEKEAIKSTYFVVSSYDFVSKWLIEVGNQVNIKFRRAHNSTDKPLILWIDEIDTNSIDESEFSVKTEFLIQMDVHDMNAVLVIGVTNISLVLASAIRQQRNFLASREPDERLARLAIFKIHFDNSPQTMLNENIKTMSKSVEACPAGNNLILIQKLPM